MKPPKNPEMISLEYLKSLTNDFFNKNTTKIAPTTLTINVAGHEERKIFLEITLKRYRNTPPNPLPIKTSSNFHPLLKNLYQSPG